MELNKQASDLIQDRETLQNVYIRIARDSGFTLPYDMVAYLGSRVLDCSPLEFWLSMDLPTMKEIACGSHPCLKLDRYR